MSVVLSIDNIVIVNTHEKAVILYTYNTKAH